jgi:hypothetical protein
MRSSSNPSIAKKKIKSSTSLILREIQIKTAMKYHLIFIQIAIMKRMKDNKCWQECGIKETLNNVVLIT